MLTPWGYEVDAIGPMLSVDDFARMTGADVADAPRVRFAIDAATSAVRDWCGWHVAPAAACRALCTPDGRIIVLPSRCVSEIKAVKDGGEPLSPGQYEARTDGLIRRAGFRVWSPGWNAVEVSFTSGFAPEECESVRHAVASVAQAALNASIGISSETAGGVSVSYATSMQSVADAVSRPGVKVVLSPYRLVRAHGL